MNIGIFVTSLVPGGAAQARFQAAVFSGLQRLEAARYNFIVLSFDVPAELKNSDGITYLKVEADE